MKDKQILAVLSVLLLVPLLAVGCVPQPTPAAVVATATPKAAASPEKVTPSTPAQRMFLDVGKQPPITILINTSPWYAGFEKVVNLYQQQTGNVVKLDAQPFDGVGVKSRNSVRGTESPYDIITFDHSWAAEFYSGGFLTPLNQIDPSFKWDPQLFTYADSVYWNSQTKSEDASGDLMSFSPQGNVLLLYYRKDLYDQAGLKPPETWDDVVSACKKLARPPELYCLAKRGERGDAIYFDFQAFLLGFGGDVLKDVQHGDFTVTFNSPEAKKALDLFVDLANNYGPPNPGALGQSDMIQYMASGKVVHAAIVTAAWGNMDNPQKSSVVGKVSTAVMPMPAGGKHASPIGNLLMGIPKNLPDSRKQAAMAFAKWFLTYDAQYEFAKAGAGPVRRDVYKSDLASQPQFRWMSAHMDTLNNYAHSIANYEEGVRLLEIGGLRLNQAVIGELSSAKALNLAAEEMYQVLKDNGRKTGLLPKLPE